jgi:hypothetical protein
MEQRVLFCLACGTVKRLKRTSNRAAVRDCPLDIGIQNSGRGFPDELIIIWHITFPLSVILMKPCSKTFSSKTRRIVVA